MAARSLARKLTTMNMVVSGTALLLAGVALATYDVLTFRDAAVRTLSIQAQIAGENSLSSLLFNDPDSAADTLAALRAAPEIVDAHIYDQSGRPFASYSRDGSRAPPAAPRVEGAIEATELRASSITLARRIEVDGMPVGTVVIVSDLQAVYDRLLRYGLIVLLVMLVAAAAAFALSRIARRSLANPLTAMVTVAHRISGAQDYTLRVSEREGSAELIEFARSFNNMLEQIQARDRSLVAAQAELEERVRQRTAELDASNKELEAFSYSVSHDLRAPLRHVTGFANLLERQAGQALDDQGRRYLKTITDAAGRMGALIDDLLAFSRMGRASLEKRPIELDEIVKDARHEVSADINGRQVVWHVHPLPVVDADPALLRPVMVNLLSNALKYSGTREQTRIEIGTVPSPDQEVVVYVRDNGVGFDMTYAHKLFGVFQRLHRAEEFSGTGIGLANVRRIIQRHGGRTWAESQPDHGATFYFSLPAPTSPAERHTA